MDHPFYDAPDFPFHRKEGQDLFRALPIAESNPAKLNLLYLEIGAGNLPLLFLQQSPDLIWSAILSNVTKAGLFLPFIELIKNRYSALKKIQEAITAIHMAKPPAEEKIFSDGTYVLDLKAQRISIQNVATDSATAKIILVRGNISSGKSHCRFVFENIANDKQATFVYIYEGMCADVRSTIEYIYSSIGIKREDIPQEDLTSPDAWYKMVVADLKRIMITREANKLPMKLWIAMDDLGYIVSNDENGVPRQVPIVDKKIRSFFEIFGIYTLDPSFAKYFRLMLINYAEPSAPTKWRPGTWLEISTHEDNIQQTDVEEFIRDWASAKKKTIPEPDLVVLAADIMKIVTNPPEEIARLPRPQRIHDTLKLKLEAR